MTAPILITGATGTLAPKVLKLLQARKLPVRAGLRRPEAATDLRAPGVELLRFDFTQPDTYRAALDGVKKIFLVSPLCDPAPGIAFVEAAKAAGVQHIVRLSVLKVDREPITIAKTKHLAEDRHLIASGVPYTILRPSNWMDNYVKHFAEAIREAGRFFLPDGSGAFAAVDLRDVADVAVKALTEPGHEGRIYGLTGGETLNNYDIAKILTRVLGRPITYVNVPESAAREAMMTLGKLTAEDVEPVLALHRLLREDLLADVTDTIPKLLGRPARTFEAFVRDHKALLA